MKSVRSPKPRLPRLLWKYCGARATPILSSSEIKLTRPKEFNDPFEWSPAVSGRITADDVVTMYEDPNWVKHWDLPALESVSAEDRQAELQSLAAKFTEISQELMEEQLDDISGRWAFLCLSANPGNILMWSHYAENHRGFAIGIDHRKLGKLSLFPIVYRDRRITFEALTPFTIKPRVRTLEIFTRKSLEWAYEREYRMIWRIDDLIPRMINGVKAYTIPLIPEAIAEVRLGCRAPQELEDEIRSILTGQGCSARITRATLHHRLFRLQFR